jgi:hypothetical protein
MSVNDPSYRTWKAFIFKNWVTEDGREWDECYQGIYDCILVHRLKQMVQGSGRVWPE